MILRPDPTSREHDERARFWWVNQITLKGGALLLLGALILASPNSEQTFDYAVASLLIVWALIEFWYRVLRSRPTAERRVSAAAVAAAFAAGLVLLLPLGVGLTVVAGLYLALRGVLKAVRAWNAVEDRRDRLVVAVALFGVGVLVLVAPGTIVLAIRAVLGAAAIAVGLLFLASGLGKRAAGSNAEGTQGIDSGSMARVATTWLRDRRLAPTRRVELAETLFVEPPGAAAKLTSFWVMMLLSVGIASFAVVQNSTAVVIGAMLVAPLMAPIMGVAAGIVNGWPRRLLTSLALVVAAVVAAVALAWLIAAWLPSVGDLTVNAQVQSRISPSLVDLCIAITAGAAGAWATVDPRTSSSLPGVAIAVALVPPLAVVGITLESELWSDAFGAFLLFFTNFVSIVLSGALVFVLTGFAVIPFAAHRSSPVRRVFQSVLLGALLILIPLSLTSQSIWDDAANEGAAAEAVAAWIPDGADLAVDSLTVDGSVVDLVLTGSALPPDTESLEQDLTEAFGTPVTLRARYVPSVALSPGEAPSLPVDTGT